MTLNDCKLRCRGKVTVTFITSSLRLSLSSNGILNIHENKRIAGTKKDLPGLKIVDLTVNVADSSLKLKTLRKMSNQKENS